MDEREKREKSRQMRKFYRKLATAVFIVALVFVAVALIVNQVHMAALKKVTTEVAYKITCDKTIEADGYAFRNETIIDSSINGICTYNVEDGDRVSKGAPVVNVYSTAEQASKVEQIEQLTEDVQALKELQTASLNTGADPDLLNKQTEEIMFELLYDLNTGNITGVDTIKNNLIYTMSKYNIVTGNETDYNEKIKELENKIENLKAGLSNASTSVTAPKAGYYISTVDGYENLLKASEVSSLTVERFEELTSQKETIASSAGKIVSDYDWYLVTVVDGNDIESLNRMIGQTVKVILPYTSEGEFKASVIRVGENASGDKAVVVLKCSNMSKTLASFRHHKVKIVLTTYTGLSVNPKAIRTAMEDGYDKDKGEFVDMQFRYVFISTGGVARKRYVEVMYEDMETETAVCRIVTDEYEAEKRSKDSFKRNYLEVYDEVIVEGADISDGKII